MGCKSDIVPGDNTNGGDGGGDDGGTGDPIDTSFSIDGPSTTVPGETVNFSAENPPADTENYEWSLGDGGVGFDRTVSAVYLDPGDYTVEVEAEDINYNTIETATTTITVEGDTTGGDTGGDTGDGTNGDDGTSGGSTGDASISGPSSIEAGDSATFTVNNPPTNAQTFRWEYDNNSGKFGQTVDFTFINSGTYTVTLEIKDRNYENIQTLSQTVEATDPYTGGNGEDTGDDDNTGGENGDNDTSPQTPAADNINLSYDSAEGGVQEAVVTYTVTHNGTENEPVKVSVKTTENRGGAQRTDNYLLDPGQSTTQTVVFTYGNSLNMNIQCCVTAQDESYL